jgi:hypothetical protein
MIQTMKGAPLLILSCIFLLTSAVGVVTGSTSLITVPAMMQFHVDPKTAVATNMFALTFMSLGAVAPVRRSQEINRKRLPMLITLTLAGSLIGASLLLLMPSRSVAVIVPSAMIAVALFSLLYRRSGVSDGLGHPPASAQLIGYCLTFLLGIYGGFFSGGYVTILTAVYVALFRMSFIEAVLTTKVMNVFSSAVATGVFMGHGLVDYRLGLILGAAMFVGGLVGARLALRIGNEWLRRIFLTAVWVLGLKALLFDVLGERIGWNHQHALDGK